MSNLHRDLDEFNLHNPRGFNPATPNTFATKSEQGSSYYEERMQLPKVINIVDGNLPAPSTADLDAFIIIDGGGGVLDLSWGPSSFNDWVRFNGGVPYRISPLAGYLAYNENGSQWKEFDGSNWVDFGGGGVVNTLYTADGTLTGARTVTMGGNSLTFDGATTIFKGAGSTSGTTALLVQNSLSTNLLEVKDDGSTTIGGNTQIDGTLTINSSSAVSLVTDASTSNYTSIKSGGVEKFRVGYFSSTGAWGVETPSIGNILVINNSTGNIGFGTTPNVDFHFRRDDASGTSMKLQNSTGDFRFHAFGNSLTKIDLELQTTANVGSIWADVTNGLRLRTNGSDRISINRTTGNVGINETTPTAKLQVKGAGSTSGTTALLVQNSLSTNLLEVKDDGSTTINGSFAVNSSTTFGFNMHVAGSFLKTANGTFRIDGTNTNALTVNGTNTYVGAGTKFTVGFTTTSASMGVYGQGADVVNFYTQSTAQRAMRITSTGLSSLSDSATNTENVNSVLTISALDNTDRAHLYFKPKTAAQASGITASDGMITYVNSTDATFTTVGFWGYENGAWVKL